MSALRPALALLLCAALAAPGAAQTRQLVSALRPVPGGLAAHAPALPQMAAAARLPGLAAAPPLAAAHPIGFSGAIFAASSLKPGPALEQNLARFKSPAAWTGENEKGPPPDAPAAPDAAAHTPLKASLSLRPRTAAALAVTAAAAAAVPSENWQVLHQTIMALPYAPQVVPWVKAAAGFALTYQVSLAADWIVRKTVGATQISKDTLDVVQRSVAGAILWSGSMASLWFADASADFIKGVATVSGAIGTAMMNQGATPVLYGVDFLVTSPFRVGDRIEIESKIDGQTGVVTDLFIDQLELTTDDGTPYVISYDELAARNVVMHDYSQPLMNRMLPLFNAALPRRDDLRAAARSTFDGGRMVMKGSLVLGAALAAPTIFALMATGGIAGWAGVALIGGLVLAASRMLVNPFGELVRRWLASWGYSPRVAAIGYAVAVGAAVVLAAGLTTLGAIHGPALFAALTTGALASYVKIAQAIAILYFARQIEQTALRFFEGLFAKSPIEELAAMKLATRGVVWLIALPIALTTAGLTMLMLGTTLIGPAIGALVASSKYLGTVLESVFFIRSEKAPIGTERKIGAHEGTVVGRGAHRLILRRADGLHVAIPYLVASKALLAQPERKKDLQPEHKKAPTP